MSGKVRIRALSRSRENRMFADALLRYILVEVLLPGEREDGLVDEGKRRDDL